MAMFDQAPDKEGAQETVIGPDVNLTGDLNSSGDINIKGKIKGQVKSSKTVIVEDGAQIEGSVEGINVIIDGTIKGNVVAKEDLEINPSGRVHGDIFVKSLSIKKGATFIGKCSQLEKAPEKEKEEIKK